MRPVHVTQEQINETLAHLRMAGSARCECVVLWLGKHEDNALSIKQIYRPKQIARQDMFWLDRSSMSDVLDILSAHDLMIAAQVHSHPYEAFHSRADDHWAIVRHVDALSLVVPHFGQRTDGNSFLDNTKTFQLNGGNHWVELSDSEARLWIMVR